MGDVVTLEKPEFPKRTKDKVAIVGFAASKTLAPLKDDSWERWGINELYLELGYQNWDRWFELHHDRFYRARGEERTAKHAENLAKLGIPVYLWEPHPEIPKSVAYPKEAVLKEFGRYFTNTISWLLALAIGMGFKEIGVWGVDMAQAHDEYARQRPSCEYFLGVAVGRGIKVYIPPESDLLKATFLYGAEDPSPLKTKLAARQQELQANLNIREQKRIELLGGINQLQAGLELAKRLMDDKGALSPEARQKLELNVAEWNKGLQSNTQQLRQIELEIAQYQGALGDCQYIQGVWSQ